MPKQLANKHYVRQYSLGRELLRSHYRRLCRREIISIERFVGRVFLVVDPSIERIRRDQYRNSSFQILRSFHRDDSS